MHDHDTCDNDVSDFGPAPDGSDLPRPQTGPARADCRSEGGFTVATAMFVMGVTLVIVVAFANLLIHRYAQAVLRQATDEGARAWALSGGTLDDCLTAANDVVDDLLAGTIAKDISITCADTGTTITATVNATLAGMPPAGDSTFTNASVVTKELEDGLVAP